MSSHGDEPTRRLGEPQPRPRTPVPPAAPGGPQYDPTVRTWEQELADRIAGLRNWLALVGVIAAAALAVGIYALTETSSDGNNASSGGSSSSVRSLERRVDDLEQQETPSASDVSKLSDDIDALDARVKSLEDAGDSGVSQGDLDALSQQVDDLSQQVSALQAAPPE
ncbi:MAG TPA: hypothetical protein VNT22_08625 [Baekduia sp.]|nr:hypothetical protein [Baekduia sp.]